MLKTSLVLAGFLCLVGASGCGGGGGDGEGSSEPQESGVKIVGSDTGRLPDAEISSEPLPTPTSNGNEPEIVDFYIQQTGEGEYEFVLEVAGTAPLDEVHLEIDGTHYVVDLSGAMPEPVPVDACEIVASASGVTCTEACLTACGCLSCSDENIGEPLAGSCAATCSIYDSQGLIGQEPYTSEAVFADIVYNGADIEGTYVPGLLDSIGGSCDASECASLAAATKTVSFGVVGVDYSFLSSLDIGAQVTTSSSSDQSASVSSQSSFAPGTINIGCAAIGCF